MLRWFLSIVVLISATAPAAMGHFMFVVPQSEGGKARLVFSETLEPDESVNVKPLAGAVLTVRSAGATAEERLSLVEAGYGYDVALSGRGTRVVRGSFTYGVQKRGSTPQFLLVYHPKTIVGEAFDPRTVIGEAAPVEIVPQGG